MAGITGALTSALVVPASRTLARRLASQLVNIDEADFRKALDGLRGAPPPAAAGDAIAPAPKPAARRGPRG